MGIQPIELTDARYSLSLVNCQISHIGKGVSLNVKSKFCDAVCAGASGGLMDVALGKGRGTCTIDKALIKGKGKCTAVFELVKDR